MGAIRELLFGEKRMMKYDEHIFESGAEIIVGYHGNARYSVRV